MKKTILLCGALLALTASVASAAGVNFAWLNCYGEGTVVQNRNFACTSNTGTNLAVGSFISPAGTTAISGNEVVIDLQSQTATLPLWWSLKSATGCRPTSLSVNFVANAANGVCVDEFQGGGAGGIGAYTVGYGGNPARARLVMAIATAAPAPLDADVEYFAFNMLINNAKTVGTGACTGCLTPVCIVLNSIKLTQGVGIGDYVLSQPGAPGSNFITWQGGAVGDGGCPAATPAKNATWGTVKSLYR